MPAMVLIDITEAIAYKIVGTASAAKRGSRLLSRLKPTLIGMHRGHGPLLRHLCWRF